MLTIFVLQVNVENVFYFLFIIVIYNTPRKKISFKRLTFFEFFQLYTEEDRRDYAHCLQLGMRSNFEKFM